MWLKRTWLARLAAVAIGILPVNAAAGQSSAGPYAGVIGGGVAVDADIATGWAPGTGIVIGAGVKRQLDLEAEVIFPAHGATRTYGGADGRPSRWIVPEGTPKEDEDFYGIWLLYQNRRDVHAAMSAALIFRPTIPAAPRLRFGLLAGVSGQRVTDHRDRTVIRVGASVPPTHASARSDSEVWQRTLIGVTVGAQLAIDVTRHLSIVPDVRHLWASPGDEINNLLQPSIRLVWRF